MVMLAFRVTALVLDLALLLLRPLLRRLVRLRSGHLRVVRADVLGGRLVSRVLLGLLARLAVLAHRVLLHRRSVEECQLAVRALHLRCVGHRVLLRRRLVQCHHRGAGMVASE